MEQKTVVDVKNISKVYPLYSQPVDRLKESLSISKRIYHTDHFALDDISFSVRKGECYGIIGTNGSGKSTLLKIITGVLTPSSGEYRVEGRISALLELGAGFNTEYTGIENIYLNGTMLGFSKAEIDERLQNIIDFAEIGEFIFQPVKTYSSGMFARLAFAVAINVDPDILIVDEALSVGDIFFQAKCYRKFDEFKSQGKTIIFVSHDLGSVLKYCDRALLINCGKAIVENETKVVVDAFKKILVSNAVVEKEDVPEEEILETETFELGTWKSGMINNPHYVEYGDLKASIIDYGIFNSSHSLSPSIHKNDVFEIRIKIQLNTLIKNPIIAFTIKNLKGVEITGTNTTLENRIIEMDHVGQVVEATFIQKASLQGGQYLLSIGCTSYEGDEFVVHHRLYDICNLEIISDHNTIGFFDLYSDCKVRNIN